MAVILKGGAARNTPTQTQGVPLRSATIHIARTGLVEKVTGATGEAIKAINLGYQGDHNVTRIYVQL